MGPLGSKSGCGSDVGSVSLAGRIRWREHGLKQRIEYKCSSEQSTELPKVNPPFLFIRLVGFDWSNFPLHVEDPESGREPAGQTTGVGKHESKAVKGRGAMR